MCYNLIKCDVMQCNMMWCDVMWCNVMWCGVMWYDLIAFFEKKYGPKWTNRFVFQLRSVNYLRRTRQCSRLCCERACREFRKTRVWDSAVRTPSIDKPLSGWIWARRERSPLNVARRTAGAVNFQFTALRSVETSGTSSSAMLESTPKKELVSR